MPYARQTLSQLENLAAQDIASSLEGSDPLLRFSNLKIMGKVQARMAYLQLGYLDWIAKQTNPFTAEGEYLEAWAALKNIFRKPATSASGAVTFTGTNGTIIPGGTALVRGDGVSAITVADAVVASGTVIVNATVVADPTGQAGAFGNADVGTAMSLSQAISGVLVNGTISTAFTGGVDIEDDDSLRSRMLQAYQSTPLGGGERDYVEWALQVPGVTRAWCQPHGFGAGTVVVYTMFDESESVHGGFPQGTDGVAAGETRDAAATGDQLTVANNIFGQQPATALVYSSAPTADPKNFTISGIPVGSRSAVQSAIADVFFREGSAKGGTIPVAEIWVAIAGISGTRDFVISTPSGDITNTLGTLPTLGVITWT